MRDFVKSGRHEKRTFDRVPYRLCPRCGEDMYRVGVHSTRGRQHVDKSLYLKYCMKCHFVLNLGEEIVPDKDLNITKDL